MSALDKSFLRSFRLFFLKIGNIYYLNGICGSLVTPTGATLIRLRFVVVEFMWAVGGLCQFLGTWPINKILIIRQLIASEQQHR